MKNRFWGAAVWPRIIMMWLVALFAHEAGAQNVHKADKQTTSSTAPERAARPSSSTRQLQSNSTFNTKS